MSVTAQLWLLALAGLTTLALFRRAAYGFSVYALTFFALPGGWWWGRPLAGFRWNLYGGTIFLVAVILQEIRKSAGSEKSARGARREDDPERPAGIAAMERPATRKLAVWMLINATIVHYLIAGGSEISADSWTLMAKFVLLFFLIDRAIREPRDFMVIVMTWIVGMMYVGYEVTINDRGNIISGRLEGIGAPGANDANLLASLTISILPVAGAMILVGRRSARLTGLLAAPLIFNVLLLCNSRGAFLACFAAGAVLLLFAGGKERKKAMTGIALAAVAAFFLLGDQRIIDRFMTTFASSEDRDTSAAGRLLFWQAATRMIIDYPLGAGGHGFKKVHGRTYLREVGVEREIRAVHNGYLNEACEWGLQGLALRLSLLASAFLAVCRAARRSRGVRGSENWSFVGTALLAAMTAFFVTVLFLDGLDSEWGLWFAAIGVGYARLSARLTIGGKRAARKAALAPTAGS